MRAAVFAGDRRVWRVAALAAVPCVAITAYYCLRPRFYYTGTNSAEAVSYEQTTTTGTRLCIPGLQPPVGTAFIRLSSIFSTPTRSTLQFTLTARGHTVSATLPSQQGSPGRPSNADFPIPEIRPGEVPKRADLCVSSSGPVKWGGTPLSKPPILPPTLHGKELAARIAVWYLPPAGKEESYAQRAGAIFSRAALFRPGIVGAWTYPVLLFLVLPLIGGLAIRCLALALAGGGRRMAAWLFVIAALNACCWALITPVFQGPDEVDHFAYAQSLVERGEGPSHNPNSPLARWSGAENLALEHTDFFTDHQVGDTHAPWSIAAEREYYREVAKTKPRGNDGGGYSTSSAHGPLYYLALAPAYLITRDGSVFSQLTLMRLTSALLGALVAMFTYLLARELAPRRQWLAVLAALLVAYEPMYGFISGIVNNDVGVNAAAAALELLLIRMLRRGMTIPWGLLTGAVLVALPMIKGTGLSLYPVAALVFLATLWRHHSRSDLLAWAGVVVGAVIVAELSSHVLNTFQPIESVTGSAVISSNAGAASEALHHIPVYLSYLWQSLFPRLPFMTRLFPLPSHTGFGLFNDPGFVIFVERGWGAFGWYDIFFPHMLYVLICLMMFLVIPVGIWAGRREWPWVRTHKLELLALIAMPVAVIMGFEAAYFSQSPRPLIAEFGRYAFPAIGPVAILVAGSLHAFGRRWMLTAGVVLVVAMISLSYASQLLELTSFYA
jgi:4-amino-4-deoxy-L-arabinose transferase-like glycosyltransferase